MKNVYDYLAEEFMTYDDVNVNSIREDLLSRGYEYGNLRSSILDNIEYGWFEMKNGDTVIEFYCERTINGALKNQFILVNRYTLWERNVTKFDRKSILRFIDKCHKAQEKDKLKGTH